MQSILNIETDYEWLQPQHVAHRLKLRCHWRHQ